MNGYKVRPLIHQLYESKMTGQEIENKSFATIDQERPEHSFTPPEWQVVRRMIHTCADFSIGRDVRFSPLAIASAAEALRSGCSIYSDSNMIRSGLSVARLQSVSSGYRRESILCHVADEDVMNQAKEEGLPRSLFAVRKAAPLLNGGIAVFGNAPVGLLELNRLIIEGNTRPALVIGMPVGFVHVLESKQELSGLGVPYIILDGRRGGSALAVSALHALCELSKGNS